MVFVVAAAALSPLKSSAYAVYTPPGNLVQNANFQSNFADWSGNIIGIFDNWASMPNNFGALANDIYQVLPTSPGQQYSLSFYSAADLYFAPSVSLTVALNGAPLTSFATPPYTYNAQVNRYDQMHWQEYTYSFTASASTTQLEFIDQNTYDFALAAVSVVPVPEPASFSLVLVGGMVAAIVRHRHLARRRGHFGLKPS
jgi:hypothetical protein